VNDRLFCFYDLAVSPCSYDFFQFLVLCEQQRIRDNFGEIEIIFVAGPNKGYREDNIRTFDQNDQMLRNVLLPGCQLLPSIKATRFESDRRRITINDLPTGSIFPLGYSINQPIPDYMYNGIVASHFIGEKPLQFVAPEYAVNSIKSYLENNNFHKKKLLTLTTRELKREDESGLRSINHKAWENFFKGLDKDQWQPIIIRDTSATFTNKSLFIDIPEIDLASHHLHLRCAIYQEAYINFCKPNGPSVLAEFGPKPMVEFIELDDDVCAVSESWYKTNLGMCVGSQFPLTEKNKILFWGKESKEIISEMMELAINVNKKTPSETHDYFNVQNLAYVADTSYRYALSKITFDIRHEHLKVFYLRDNLISKKILNGKLSLDIISDLEGISLPIGMRKEVIKNYEKFKIPLDSAGSHKN
jgi:hypothetical protein